MKLPGELRKLVAVAFSLSCLLSLITIHAEVPREVSYQGVLLNENGIPLPGLVDLVIRFYDGATGGAPLFEEEHTDIGLANGVYTIQIGGGVNPGTSTPTDGIPDSILSTPQLWLGVLVDGDEELSPRTSIGSVIFALKSKFAEALRNSEAGEASIIVDDNGNVGIGTDSPSAKLGVAGGINIGDSVIEKAGTIRWTGTDFEGFTGARWVSLTRGNPEPPPLGMSLIPEGTFQMGDNYSEGEIDERPIHNVFVSAFYMDQLEVTNEKLREVLQWAFDNGKISATATTVANLEGNQQELLDLESPLIEISFSNNSFVVDSGRENFPCVEVTWFGAQAYCNYRSDIEGLERSVDFNNWSVDLTKNGYRLPTEAEWEKAARGGLTGHHFPWDSGGGSFEEHIDGSRANYDGSRDPFEDSFVGSTPVGYYNGSQTPMGEDMANGFGLYDMAGNMWEWCSDWWQSDWYSLPDSSTSNTQGPANGTSKCNRGGTFNDFERFIRCASRNHSAPSNSHYSIGFRSARSL